MSEELKLDEKQAAVDSAKATMREAGVDVDALQAAADELPGGR
jgi:hypothetical protein